MGRLSKVSDRKVGDKVFVKKEITSSDILTTVIDLTGPVNGGDLLLVRVVLATDSTGLAGGTNIEITASGETYGLATPIIETVANLGASALRVAPHSATAADTTNDNHMTVTAGLPFVLQNGDKLQINSTSAACTGAGKLLVLLEFERITAQADIAPA